jgi:ABC-type polysaccharide/polyol phosphate transport system ATPase subunit
MPGTSNGSQGVYALQDIDLEVFKGQRVGIIGNNGAGKSTLLKLVAGLHKPSSGEVTVAGEVALLTGFGIGLVGELTVSENIYLYGAIHGMEREMIRERFEDVVEWAELENFRTVQLKALSSGMGARLAFSVARHIETDVMLLDEALTAGDKNFGKKCEEYFEDAKSGGRTFLVATHDLKFVQTFCNKALWLDKGRQKAFGDAETVMQQYSSS